MSLAGLPEQQIPLGEQHPIPKHRVSWAEQTGTWFYRSWSDMYPRCEEEREYFVDSFGGSRDPRPRSFGNTVAQNAMWLLDTHGPYPGDHHVVLKNGCELLSPMGRFKVYQVSETHHAVTDTRYYNTYQQEALTIPTAWLEIEDFSVVLWYA
ncbi:hypothetical protein IW261DRAFT_1420981 [Armillaria novae-zelandiae]|uniref:Uncharacterized protein n=1 Tax=Armillaria novae-zelandiae TaxID=153914 RepID=A0AA39P465_9AGAR|nr:hypothetical protein IW261DRAFT_1420981 [Armillaria novae-zelandiae]